MQSFMQMYVSVIRQMSKMPQDTVVKLDGFLVLMLTLAQNGESELEKNTHLSRKVANMLLMFV